MNKKLSKMCMTADEFSLLIVIHSNAVLKFSNILHDEEHPMGRHLSK